MGNPFSCTSGKDSGDEYNKPTSCPRDKAKHNYNNRQHGHRGNSKFQSQNQSTWTNSTQYDHKLQTLIYSGRDRRHIMDSKRYPVDTRSYPVDTRSHQKDDRRVTVTKQRANSSSHMQDSIPMLSCEDYVANNGLNITCYIGDVTKAKADGIVTGEDCRMRHASAVTKSLCDLAQIEYRELVNLINRGDSRELNCGEVYCLDVKHYDLQLPFRMVLLAIVLQFDHAPDVHDWTSQMVELYGNILQKAERNRIESLAIPLLGSGRAGAPFDIAVEAVVDAVSSYQVRRHLKHVLLVSFVEDVHNEIINQWRDYFSQDTTRVETQNVLKEFVKHRSQPTAQKKSEVKKYGSAVLGRDVNDLPSETSPPKLQRVHEQTDEIQLLQTRNSNTGHASSLWDSETYYKGRSPHQGKLKPGEGRSNPQNDITVTLNEEWREVRIVHPAHQLDPATDAAYYKKGLYPSVEDPQYSATSENDSSAFRVSAGILESSSSFGGGADSAQPWLPGDEKDYGKHPQSIGDPSYPEASESEANVSWVYEDTPVFSIRNPSPMSSDASVRHSKQHDQRGNLPGPQGSGKRRHFQSHQEDGQSADDTRIWQQTKEEESSSVSKTTTPDTCAICMDEITNSKRLSKCGHTFCTDCIDNCFNNFKPVCPTCNMVYGILTGDMPPGDMKVSFDPGLRIPGYGRAGVIIIDYLFQDGIQTEKHPNPGKSYHGARRRAFLPDTVEGQTVLRLLKIAFDRRLTFTIGRSTTTGREDTVTWNDIHHKTSLDGGPVRFGYPDATYFARVKDELASKGVTEQEAWK
ncbi:uncharacterized protein LOC121377336 isoform X2 [Gigantopelta aegis]|uniref:uncharacterized protein LOC121377336 isoform X2 n=1 Tax=Gigantopelta aegis TaxID=1735272 RepID=UPI001B88BE5E|nr:uncharacterized protein LOC121377336 isoform X2 [Gigantopelta aegis]